MEKLYTHVIWDFNGTVLNDAQLGISCVNRMLRIRGLPTVNGLEAYREIFDFPVEDYYRRLGFDFEKEDYKTVLAPEWVQMYCAHSCEAPLYEGVRPLAAALRQAGVHQSILSASERAMLCRQLEERDAADVFDEVWGTDSIHAYGKEGLAKGWRAAHQEARALMLGDTTHDAEIAAVLGADCILIADGHHSKERLLRCGVTVVQDLAECAKLLHERGII